MNLKRLKGGRRADTYTYFILDLPVDPQEFRLEGFAWYLTTDQRDLPAIACIYDGLWFGAYMHSTLWECHLDKSARLSRLP